MTASMQSSAPRGAIRWIRAVIGSGLWLVGLLCLLEVLLGLYGVALAWLLRCLIDSAVAQDAAAFQAHALAIVGLVCAQVALSCLRRWASEKSRATVENRLKTRLLNALLTHDLGKVEAVHTGEWMNRLMGDAKVVADGVTAIAPGVAGMAAKLVGAIALLAFMVPQLALILAAGGIVLLVAATAFRRVMKRLHKDIQQRDGQLRILLTDVLSANAVVRAFGRERQVDAQAEEAMGRHLDARMTRNRFSNAANAGFGLAMGGAYAFGAIWCAWGILNGAMTAGTLVATIQLVNQVQSPFANISSYLPQFFSMTASAERLMEAEGFENEPCSALDCRQMDAFYDSLTAIEIEDVSFGYEPAGSCAPGRQDGEVEMQAVRPNALTGCNLSIPKGGLTALAGPSGCGKSTALKLLMCLHAPASGKIFLRGASGREALTPAHRGLFAYVPQGNHLLSGSIRSAVAFGDETLSHDDAALESALRTACAWDFVSELPQGLDTPLGEGGAGLSEGQIQRLAVARALAARRRILLLDECTSSLDEPTERQLLENLKELEGITVVAVTHRPAALELADRVFVFAEGGCVTTKCDKEACNE